MRQTARTPKIFGSSYQPPRPTKSLPKLGNSWKAIVFVLAVFIAIVMIGRLPIFRLRTVELLGDQNDAVAAQLAELKGQSIFSHAVTALIDQTRNNVAVANFNCRRGIPNVLRCNLSMRAPAIVWQSGDAQYLVDQAGILYATKTADVPSTIIVNDLQKQPVKPGSTVASTELIKQYQDLVTQLAVKQLSVVNLQLSESLYQVTAVVNRPDKSPIQILFLLSGDVPNQIESVSAVISQKGDSITQTVDARVPGYIYTK